MKTIGLIGGMSFESTIHYYERINEQVNALAGDLTCAQMIIYNVNFEEIRQLMLANEWDKLGVKLGRIAKALEEAGTDFVAIATNTMHKVADVVQKQINVPLVHIADCVARRCIAKKVYNVGLLGTKYTMVEDFLKDRLNKNGLTVSIPKENEQINEIDRIIFDELCKGEIKEASKEYLVDIINRMVKENWIEGIILGCTELEMLVKQSDLSIPVFDTTQCHIDYLVDLCLERRDFFQ